MVEDVPGVLPEAGVVTTRDLEKAGVTTRTLIIDEDNGNIVAPGLGPVSPPQAPSLTPKDLASGVLDKPTNVVYTPMGGNDAQDWSTAIASVMDIGGHARQQIKQTAEVLGNALPTTTIDPPHASAPVGNKPQGNVPAVGGGPGNR